MDGGGAFLGSLGCIAAVVLVFLHDFYGAGAVLLISLVLFGAERLLK